MDWIEGNRGKTKMLADKTWQIGNQMLKGFMLYNRQACTICLQIDCNFRVASCMVMDQYNLMFHIWIVTTARLFP